MGPANGGTVQTTLKSGSVPRHLRRCRHAHRARSGVVVQIVVVQISHDIWVALRLRSANGAGARPDSGQDAQNRGARVSDPQPDLNSVQGGVQAPPSGRERAATQPTEALGGTPPQRSARQLPSETDAHVRGSTRHRTYPGRPGCRAPPSDECSPTH